MQILLITDDLMTRVRLESRWRNAGATVSTDNPESVPELVVVDLGAANGIARLREQRERYPEARLVAYGPHVEGETFKAARAAGADEVVARGKVAERVLGRIGA